MITPIIILCLLAGPLAIAYFYCKSTGTILNKRKFAYWGLSSTFLLFAIGHLVKADGMVAMLPPWVPYRLALVYLSGLLELFIAITLLQPKYQSVAAKMAIAVFVLFFPVNIYAAFNHIGLGGHQWGPSYLLIRAPLQLILIAWTYFLCVKGSANKTE
ncbi:MAG: hypothetical protein HRU06_15060 [Oceanospirillaceae bacterium]|nr:hypothetical protein [Oceanospirillaceae bacterium]